VIVVLLIACSNVASLMLARAALRRRELALRVALGASRFRIVRGVLAESLLLAAAGGMSGLLLAWWLMPILQAQLTGDLLPRAEAIGLDAPVLWFSAAVTLTCGVLFGVVPATASSRRDVARTIEQGSRGHAAPQHGLARQALVVGQMALAVMILAGAGLLAQSLRYLHRVDLGFDPQGLTTAMIGLPEHRYDTAGAHQFYDRLLARLSASAGVERAAIASGAPLTGSYTSMQVRAVGTSALPDTDVQADWRIVSGGYFDAMRLPILRGRSFDSRDAREDAPKVIVISADLARRLWPDRDPIGREVRIGNGNVHRVVGIAAPARILTLGLDPRPAMYFSSDQVLWDPMVVVARSGVGTNLAPVLRGVVADLYPLLPLFSGSTMEELIARDAAQPRLTAWMVGVFAGLALLLAAIGLYGVIAFLVTQRTQEIGVRMALGARPASVLRLVLGRSARLAAIGIAIGLLAALAAGPILGSLLFGVRPRDPLTLATAGVVLFLLSLTASYLPARRATRVDPVVALRAE
jgi:predicted permease